MSDLIKLSGGSPDAWYSVGPNNLGRYDWARIQIVYEITDATLKEHMIKSLL